MNQTDMFARVLALTMAAALFPAYASDRRYPVDRAEKIEITERSGRTAWEDKKFLDCDDVVLAEEDVRYALHHMRKVSKKSYSSVQVEETGCEGSAQVTFANGKTIAMGIEPTGRINVLELDARLQPVAGKQSYYDCEPCKTRKMALLKDALDRATERRLKSLEAEGKIPPGEAARRLKALQSNR